MQALGHLAGQEPLPDQLIKLILVIGQAVLHLVRGQADHGGTNRLMSILSVCSGLKMPGLLRQIFLSPPAADIFPGIPDRILGQAQRVGSHIGDQAGGAHALYIDTLVKLLGRLHGAAGLEAELSGGLLL